MTQTKAELLQTRHQGDIRLGDADSTHYVGFKAPATVGTSLVWTLPAADGTANYLLKTDGSGNLGWVADSSTDSTKMPLAGGTFTGDVTFTGASANIVFDKSDNALEFADAAKAVFGTDSDSFLQFDGTNTILRAGTSPLYIQTDGTTFITKNNGTETLAKFIGDGAVELYFNNSKKFETLTTGNYNTGTLQTTGQIFVDRPTDFWSTGSSIINIADYGQLATEGSYEICLTAGGYRNSSGWVDYTVNSISGFGCQLALNPTTGNVSIRSETGMSTGGSRDITEKLTVTTTKINTNGGVSQTRTAVSALELDLNTSNYFTKTISGNSTFTFANPAASGKVTAFTLELTHSSGTVTWPSSVKWNADTAPTLTTGKTHLFMFVTDDGGTRYRGSALVDYVN